MDSRQFGKCQYQHFYQCFFFICYLESRSYWSNGWPYQNDNFRSIMSSCWFELILKFIHLNDSRQQPARGEPGYDKLYKVRPLLNLVVENFQSMYTPTQSLSIDESMVGFKGRLAFLQYMPKKPHKWGMKAWVLADAANGYVWNWKLYTGKDESLLVWLTGWYSICLMMTGVLVWDIPPWHVPPENIH